MMHVETDRVLAFRFCEALFEALREALSDPAIVRGRMITAQTKVKGRGKSNSLREEHFCKSCVLPVVDAVATQFLGAELALTRPEVHAALRCEGKSNLLRIYEPGLDQSGFSRASWGTNYQPINKQGQTAPMGHRGYLPCPDFGVVHRGHRKFSLVGETKISRDSETVSLAEVESQTRYYVALPWEPDKDWDYDFGFGIAYAGGGSSTRKARLITDHWASDRFVIAQFQA